MVWIADRKGPVRDSNLTYDANQWEGAFGLLAFEAESTARYEYLAAAPEDPGARAEIEDPLKAWLRRLRTAAMPRRCTLSPPFVPAVPHG